MEAVFLLALVASIAALHYTRDFHSAFAHLASDLKAVQQSSPLHNYLSLLALTLGAYLAARGTCAAVSSILPGSVKSNRFMKTVLIAVSVPAASWALYIAAGAPPLGEHVAVRWMLSNWERNGKRDVAWCARLFILLFCWQTLLAVGVTVIYAITRVAVALVKFCLRNAVGNGKMHSSASDVSAGIFPVQKNGHGGPHADPLVKRVALRHGGMGVKDSNLETTSGPR